MRNTIICDKFNYNYNLPGDLIKLSELKPYRRVNVIGKVIERGEGERTTSLFICDGTQKVQLFSYIYDVHNNLKECHKKIENIKINDIIIFRNLYANPYKGILQIEVDNATDNPVIVGIM